MLNLAAVVLLLQIRAPVGVEASASVQGAVRSDATGVVVGGARVEMLDALASVLSDSAGAYFLQGLTPGAHRLRFSAHGFQPLAIDVLLVDGAPLSLDVSLSPIPARLVPVKILAPVRLRSPDTTAITFEAGSWSVSGEKVRNSTMLADADAFRLLAGAPQAQMSPESPASVHVRGGSADQNLVLLDGAPVFSPVHPGYVLSAFSPDIIDALVLHGGAPSARYGGQLSSVVDVRTPRSIPQTVATRGSFGPTAMRGSLDLPLVDGKAGLTLSARHSYSGLRRQDLAEGSMPGTWFDLFGKLSLRLGNDDITLSSFASDNALGFPASAASIDTVFRAARDNSFEWTSATQSAAWRRDIGARTQFEMIAWRARFDGGAVWTRDTLSLGMYSAVRNVGLSSTLAISHARGRFTSGFQVERFSSRYIVNRIDSTGPSSDESLLQRSAAPLIRSLFAEERWSPIGDWTIVAGFRAAFVPGRAPRGEPRISLAFHPENRVQLSVGYARMHQFTQSLRGEESFLGTIVGPDFLAGVGAERIPVANSNEMTASVMIPVAKESRLRFDWYGRNLSNLILPASANLDPFASRDYAIGSGEAWGLAASVESRIRRVSLSAAYSLGFARRVTDSVQFRPAFAASRSASLAVGYDASARTRFHSVMWVAAGRRTTLLSDDIGWDTRDPFSGAREVSGSPQRTQGPLDGTRLPLYLRFDVGARHAMSLWRTRAEVTGFAGVNNVFGRKNTTGYVQPAGTSTRRDLRMLPPSVVLGLEWRF